MKKGILILVVMFAGSNVWALHWFNCSSADGSVAVVEREIWGANPTGCYYKGEAVEEGRIELDKKTEKEIEKKSGFPDKNKDWERTFAVKGKLSSAKGLPAIADDSERIARLDKEEKRDSVEAWLICKEVNTSALDFANIEPPCEVIRK